MFRIDERPMYLIPEKGVTDDFNSDVLTNREALKRKIEELCNILRHPVAVFDYRRMVEHKGEIAEKIESDVNIFSIRSSCNIFRRCAGWQYCTMCDQFHAQCMDVKIENIEAGIKNALKQIPDFFYDGYSDNPPVVLRGFKRPILEYHCPMLGYRELLFPICYGRDIFGVLYVGQIIVYSEGDAEKNRDITEQFFQKNDPEKLFGGYLEDYRARGMTSEPMNADTIASLIQSLDYHEKECTAILSVRADNEPYAEHIFKSFNTKEEYYLFLEQVCNELETFERNLASAYEEKRKAHFNNALRAKTNTFIKDYANTHEELIEDEKKNKNVHKAVSTELNWVWDTIPKVFSWIPESCFFIPCVFVFGDGVALKIDHTEIKELQFAFPDYRFSKEARCDLSKIGSTIEQGSINSLENPNILSAISGLESTNNQVLIASRDLAVLIEVRDLEKHRLFYHAISKQIGDSLPRLGLIVALCTANMMKEKHLATLRLYRHETAHISTRLGDSLDRYFENNGKVFCNLDEKKHELAVDDISNTVELISNLADNIGVVTGSISENSSQIKEKAMLDVYDMLFKWQIMFREELRDRNLDVIVKREYDISSCPRLYATSVKSILMCSSPIYGEAPRIIEINSRLFELLVYNLVDNAVKYAFMGTNIYLVWCRTERGYELSVTSYGPEMQEGEAMYELYARGENRLLRSKQGDGLGLYVVKRIAALLDLKVFHTVEKLSNYNIPLVPWIERPEYAAILKEENLSIAQMRDCDEEQVANVINANEKTAITNRDLTEFYLRKNIYLETWRTTFHVLIPK